MDASAIRIPATVGAWARLMLLLISAGAVAPRASAAQQYGVGVHIGQNQNQVETALSDGPFSLRTDALWQWVETTQGNLSYPDNLKSWLDPIINTIVPLGAQPLIVLDYGNKFYDGGGEPSSAAGIAAYARYAGFMAAHYKGTVSQFEIWNEWNLAQSDTNATAGTAGAYVAMLKAAYAAIKAANPAATVVAGGGVTNLDSNWVMHFIAAGGLAYADAFSVHPYVHSRARKPAPPALSSRLLPIAAAQAQSVAPVGGTPEDAIAWVDQVHTMLDNAAGRSVPIFITEIGWATNMGQYGFSEETQAAYLQRFLLLAHARSYIGGVWWYDLIDDGPDNTNYFQRFGLLRQSGAQKGAFTALLQIKSLLLAPSIAIQGTGSNGEITISGTLANGKKYYAAWLPTDDFYRTAASGSVASMLGSGYVPLAAANGTTSTLSANPLVIAQQ